MYSRFNVSAESLCCTKHVFLWILILLMSIFYGLSNPIFNTKELMSYMYSKYHFEHLCDVAIQTHLSSVFSWNIGRRRLWLVPENDLCLRKESLVTQLKANVTLVIASHNVNHPCGVAHTESKDGALKSLRLSVIPCPSALSPATQFWLFSWLWSSGCLTFYCWKGPGNYFVFKNIYVQTF